LPTRYNKIADHFQKRDALDLSLAEEIRRLAADIEEIMILKGQPEFVNTICSTIIRAYKDPKMKYKLTRGQESYIYDVLVKVGEGKYIQSNTYGRSLGITGNLPEENTIQFRQVQQAYSLIKQVTEHPTSFTRKQLTQIAEMTIENKDDVISLCKNYKIAILDSDVSQSSLWEGDDNDKYTQQIQTDKSNAKPNTVQEFWLWFGKLCFEIAQNCHDFPPQIKEREKEITDALYTYAQFFIPGKDMKYKRHWCDWFEIGKKVDDTSINNAANKSPAFANLCATCKEPDFLQDPTGSLGLTRHVRMKINILGEDEDNHIKWNWKCPKCGGHDMAERTMTKERTGDMIPTVLEYAQRMISDLPLACEFMDWFNEWRLPIITAQTIALSPKLEEKC